MQLCGMVACCIPSAFGSLGHPRCLFHWAVQGFFKGLVHATLQIAQYGTARVLCGGRQISRMCRILLSAEGSNLGWFATIHIPV